MSGLFAGTSLERPVTCETCEKPLAECRCPRDGAGKVLLPSKQTASVRVEKRRKGKIITVITGLDRLASDHQTLLKQLKAACGAGGTVSDDGIEIQGDQREKIKGVLAGMGYKVRVK